MERILNFLLNTRVPVGEEKLNALAIVGPPRSGKTTLLRRLARAIMDKRTEYRENENPTERNFRYELVCYIDVKDIELKESTDLADLLFGNLIEDKTCLEYGYLWFLENQSKVIIAFDGLDDAKWHFDRRCKRKVSPRDKANTATLMYNLLSRQLLPRTQIVVTSEKPAIAALPPEARPQYTVTLGEFIRPVPYYFFDLTTIVMFFVFAAIFMSKDSNSNQKKQPKKNKKKYAAAKNPTAKHSA